MHLLFLIVYHYVLLFTTQIFLTAAIMLPTMLIASLFASSLLEYIEFIYSEIHLIR